MLRSTLSTVSAPASIPFRGSITHPAHPLCTLRGRRCRRLTQHSLPGGLLGLAWVGLGPTDRASCTGAFREPGPIVRRTRTDEGGGYLLTRSGSPLTRFFNNEMVFHNVVDPQWK